MARIYVPLRAPNPPLPPVLSLVNAALTVPSTWEDEAGTVSPSPATGGHASGTSRWTGGFAYAPENHYAAETRDPCDSTTVDSPGLTPPAGTTAAAATTGGSLAAGTYTYGVTFTNGDGETTAATISATIPVTTPVTSHGSVRLTIHFPDDARARGIAARVYGRSGTIGLLGTVTPTGTGDQTPGTGTFTDTGSVSPGAAPPAHNTTAGPGAYGNLGAVEYVPFLVDVEDSCSAFGWDARDFKGRAQRLLDNATPQAVGREFMHGYLASKAGWPNNYLTSAAVVDLTPATVPSVARGQQILQDALAQCGFGGVGMLHVQPETAPNLLSARRVDNGDQHLLLDVFDNRIVVDPGYDGLGPGNAATTTGETYMYATTIVSVLLDSPRVIPDSFSEALDRGEGGQPNRITFRAQRFAAAVFDGACQFAVRVNTEA